MSEQEKDQEQEEEMDLESMNREELVEALYGGLYSLLTEEEDYEELAHLAFALGLKHFMDEKVAGLSDTEIRGFFGDADTLLQGMVQFAVDKGLVEVDEHGEGCACGCEH